MRRKSGDFILGSTVVVVPQRDYNRRVPVVTTAWRASE
jgi:hypothetical protein